MKRKQEEITGGDVAEAGGQCGPKSPARRRVLVGGVAAGAALMLGAPSVFAAGSRAGSGASADKEIRIGYISPRSGNLGLFGVADGYVLKEVRKALANGITVNGERYAVKIFDRDSQSSPSRASQLANDLVNKHHIDLMLSADTPETVNPVSDVCEASGVPGIASNCPLESFFFGRGGKIGKPSPFKWAFDFSFGVKSFADSYIGQWPLIKTNKKVAVMYPNDADGNGFRGSMIPLLEKHGYKVIDPGAYADGTTDFSAQIATFKREKCQIYNGVGLPPDIFKFWRQSAELRFLNDLKIAEMTKASASPGQLNGALGPLAYNIASSTYWSPVYPYRSPLLDMTSQQLADGYQKISNKLWTPTIGTAVAVFEAGIHVLQASKDPHNKAAVRDVIPKLDMITLIGRVNFKTGPYPNTAETPMVGAQYVKGDKYPLDFVVVDNTEDRNVPVQRKPVAYHA